MTGSCMLPSCVRKQFNNLFYYYLQVSNDSLMNSSNDSLMNSSTTICCCGVENANLGVWVVIDNEDCKNGTS